MKITLFRKLKILKPNYCNMIKIIITLLTVFLILSCESGLSPVGGDQRSYLEVKLNYVKGVSNWPPQDSVFGIRIAAFKKMPDSNIIADIIAGNAYFTIESQPMYVDSSSYTFEIKDAPQQLLYIAAVQQYDSLIFSQRVIGVYSVSGNKKEHSPLLVEKGKKYKINIDIDFKDLPPMPF